jgi:hypothetical protein
MVAGLSSLLLDLELCRCNKDNFRTLDCRPDTDEAPVEKTSSLFQLKALLKWTRAINEYNNGGLRNMST